jgi:hypothetical protein
VDGTATRVLVAWYGIYQAGHLVFNVRYLLDPGQLPFPAPAAGWSPQLTAFLYGMAAADAVNAALALGFVVGFFARRGWRNWLGTLTIRWIWVRRSPGVNFSAGHLWPAVKRTRKQVRG